MNSNGFINSLENTTGLLIGVDGGASKTACTVLDPLSKKVISESKTGSANQNSVGKIQADQNVIQSIQQALQNANKNIHQVKCICLCLSGINSSQDEDQARIRILAKLQNLGLSQSCQLLVYNDAVAALSCGTLGLLRGIVLIGGTGSVAYGRKDAKEARAAGWGPAFLDEGCGYDLGQQGLVAAAQNFDGRGPPTKLTQYFSDHFQINIENFLSITNFIYEDLQWARIAELAPIVIQCAQEGDEVSMKIIQRGINGIINSILAVAKKLNWGDENQNLGKAPVVFAGGLLEGDSLYPKLLEQQLKEKFPNCQILYPKVSCAEGAALVALNYCQLSNGSQKELE